MSCAHFGDVRAAAPVRVKTYTRTRTRASAIAAEHASGPQPIPPCRYDGLMIQNFTGCGSVQGPAIPVSLDNYSEDVSPPARRTRRMMPNVIPITPLYLRYRALRRADQAERLRYARDVLANPAWLAEEFVTTVLRFGEYDNADQHFYGKRDAHTFGTSLEATKDLVLRLEALPSVTPVDAGDRQIGGTGHPDVIDVPAPELAFEYVDRELLLQRTKSPAQWENGAINRGGIRPDILLADLEIRTPIVAELKLPGDMDPFFALVQALAGAAHLATSAQYERMRNHLKRGKFPALSAPPRLDVFTLFVGRTEGSNQPDFHRAAQTLPPQLLAHDGLARSIRRIAGISVALGPRDQITAEVLFAWERTDDHRRLNKSGQEFDRKAQQQRPVPYGVTSRP